MRVKGGASERIGSAAAEPVAVFQITQKRKPLERGLDPDLVGAAGFKDQFDQSDGVSFPGRGSDRPRVQRSFLRARAPSCDDADHVGALILAQVMSPILGSRERTIDPGKVRAMKLPFLKALRQSVGGLRPFGYDEDAARVAVEAMDEPDIGSIPTDAQPVDEIFVPGDLALAE